MTTTTFAPVVGDVLDVVIQEALRTRYAWNNYRSLFVAQSENVEVLNATAPDFFGWTQGLIVDSVLLGISRLTDPGATFGEPNATLQRLVDLTDWKTTDQITWQRFTDSLATVVATCKLCRQHRHKRLGHSDRAIAMRATKLPEVTVRNIDDALESIERFLGELHLQLRPDHSQSFQLLNGDEHVKKLLGKLTNRASRRRPDAVSRITKKQGQVGAVLECAFCGEMATTYIIDGQINARRLRVNHYNRCHCVIGCEAINIVVSEGDGEADAKMFVIKLNS